MLTTKLHSQGNARKKDVRHDEQALRAHELLAALGDSQWRALRPYLHELSLPAGRRLFVQGDRAECFFLVRSGALKLFRMSPHGREKIMRAVHAGQSFAESTLFMEPPRYPVHAQAIEDCELVAIEREAYLRMIERSFKTCRALFALMTRRILTHWDEIEALSLRGSVARVAWYLTQKCTRRGVEAQLPLLKSQIAAQLGLAPETLSRSLRSLAQQGAISVRGASVRLLDMDRLREIAGA